MHRELVDERRWIGEQRFLHALWGCTLLPGPEAQQLAIYLGWLLNGTVGRVTMPACSTISPRAVFVTALAFVLVFRFKLAVLRVLGICAGVGAGLYLASH